MKKFALGTFSWVTSALASSSIILAMLGSSSASAALLNIAPGLPLMNYNNTGSVSYNAGTDAFATANALPIAVLFTAVGPPRFVFDSTSDGPKSVQINIVVDSAGNLVGGAAGDDLRVVGAVDTTGDSVLDADGVLLTGEIVAFGWMDSGAGGTTDFYDFRFVVTGGLLATLPGYMGQDIGVTMSSEGSNFTGSFAVNFGGAAKGNIGPIPKPDIEIEKFTNGHDGDTANGNPDATNPGPFVVGAIEVAQVAVNGAITWTYEVKNTGSEALVNVMVTDSEGELVICPNGQPFNLGIGQTVVCEAFGSADDLALGGYGPGCGAGGTATRPTYNNVGDVVGFGASSNLQVIDDDPSHYCNPPESGILVEKLTDGLDADSRDESSTSYPPPFFDPTIPQIAVGQAFTWSYLVTNTGATTLNDVTVVDDAGTPGDLNDDFCTPNAVCAAPMPVIMCPKDTLVAGETMTCTASGTGADLSGNTTRIDDRCGGFPDLPLYENMGKASGTSVTGEFVEDEDASHYCNPPGPAILVEKLTKGLDADSRDESSTSYPPPLFDPTIPQINVGEVFTWSYLVTNTGNVTLDNVSVVDDAGTPGILGDDFCTPNGGCAILNAISCPKTTLVAGEMMTCTASGTGADLSGNMVRMDDQCGGTPNTPLYENMGKARGETITGDFVEDDDASHYCNPPQPAIKLEKLTNGFDADTADESMTSFPLMNADPTVPSIVANSMVTWTYKVTNTGNTVLDPVKVSDDAGTPGNIGDDFCTPNAGPCAIEITCPLTVLTPGQTMDCSAQMPAHDLTVFTPVVAGMCGGIPRDLYENGAVATGTPPSGPDVMDDDPSHYCNPGMCELEVDKTCLVIPPPSSNPGVGSCQKPIDVLKLEYAGSKTINGVTWYSGDVDPGEVIRSATAGEVATLNGGGVVEFDGFETNNSPNDVHIVTSFTDGTSETSQFHLSCSDPEMKLPEHCGTVIGDGKSDALPNGKFWTFRGAVRLDGVGLICPLPPAGPAFPTQTACEFTPPVSAASCDDIKPITALTMIWNGVDNVNIQGPGGQVISDIDNGDVVTFDAGGFGNDVELTLSGGTTGTSQFHVSCSDDDMDGPEDCGTPQGNGKNDDAGFNNQWALGGMTGEDGVIDCGGILGSSGAEVSYGIAVNNLNNEAVDVTISDPLLGLNVMQNIPANSTFELITDPQLIVPDGSNVFVNVVNVTGTTASGASCDASAMASLTRKPPPPAPVSCSDIKPIAKLTMVWNGPGPVDITIDDTGQLFEGVQNNNQITFDTLGIGNDVDVTISGAVNANATFHVSCSDQGMNGSEDCGTNQGNGKNNDGGLNNQFLLDGMTGEGSNGAFACNLNNSGVVDPTPGGGPGGGGNVTGASSLELSDDKVKWELTNNGNQDVFITRVVVSWPSQHEKLDKMKLAGDFAKNVNDSSSPTAVPDEKAFESDPDKRRLEAGDDDKLEIEFDEKYKNNSQSDYTITVEFDNGQTLSFP